MNTRNGFSIIEIMIGLTLGLILTLAVLGVYIAQKNTYKTNTAQAQIQSSISAISALISPTIRTAGFCGCNTVIQAVSNLNAGGPPPISTLSTNPSMIMGYEAAQNTINQINPANSTNAGNWNPTLDSSLTGSVEPTSDVIVVFGGNPNNHPIGVTKYTSGSNSFDVQDATGITSGQFAAISDCLKATVFLITGINGNSIVHDSGTGALSNSSSSFNVNYSTGSQFLVLTQTAFFVAYDASGQSALIKATLNSNGTWSSQALASGVDTIKVLYGVGSSGIPTQYVAASAVTNWSQVGSVRIAFLLEGQQGSQTKSNTQYTVAGKTVTVPADNKLRHVFEMTISLRNSQT